MHHFIRGYVIMETMTDMVNRLAASLVSGEKSAPTARRDNIEDCRRGDLIEIDGGKMMIFLEKGEKKFQAIDKKTNRLYSVPNELLLRIAQGEHKPDITLDWQSTLNPGDLFYIFCHGRCELYSLRNMTDAELECTIPHTGEPCIIPRGKHEGRKLNGRLETAAE